MSVSGRSTQKVAVVDHTIFQQPLDLILQPLHNAERCLLAYYGGRGTTHGKLCP